MNGLSSLLYVKPTHSNHITPWTSHIPYQQKLALLNSEIKRAIRNTNSSDRNDLMISLDIIRNKFSSNGYPLHLINKHIHRLITPRTSMNYNNINNNNNNNDDKPTIYIRMPHITDKTSNLIRNQFNRYNKIENTNIKPTFVSAPKLSIQLQKHPNLPCPQTCICNQKQQCLKKNIVYQVKCNLCNNGTYIGESHRTFKTRMTEHITDKDSHVFQHLKKHTSTLIIEHIDCTILATGFKNTLERLSSQKYFINKRKPTINKQLRANELS